MNRILKKYGFDSAKEVKAALARSKLKVKVINRKSTCHDPSVALGNGRVAINSDESRIAWMRGSGDRWWSSPPYKP